MTQIVHHAPVLVTGGAGYIGSHTVRQLLAAGYRVVVVDSLMRGWRALLPNHVLFFQKDIADEGAMREILKKNAITSVLHFAGFVRVDESVKQPEMYYENNLVKAERLLSACLSEGVSNFIFSSTAAVYGDTGTVALGETLEPRPTNPYSAGKWMFERILSDISRARPLRHVILRYFNVAGASPDGTIGQIDPKATHLVKVAAEAACGVRKKVSVFGSDYSTLDGSGIRDYIHVVDLANAHVKALQYLESGGSSDVFNCGYGRGFTVKQVLDAMKRVSGVDFPVEIEGRRPGDVTSLIADNTKIKRVLGWKPEYDDLDFICKTAYEWEKKLHSGKFDKNVSQALQESPSAR